MVVCSTTSSWFLRLMFRNNKKHRKVIIIWRGDHEWNGCTSHCLFNLKITIEQCKFYFRVVSPCIPSFVDLFLFIFISIAGSSYHFQRQCQGQGEIIFKEKWTSWSFKLKKTSRFSFPFPFQKSKSYCGSEVMIPIFSQGSSIDCGRIQAIHL